MRRLGILWRFMFTFAVVISLLPTQAFAADISNQTDVEVSNIVVDSNPIREGTYGSISFDFVLEAKSTTAFSAGDVVEISTNVGELFAVLSAPDVNVQNENGEIVASASVQADKVILTLANSIAPNQTVLSSSIKFGARFQANVHGATATVPVKKELQIGTAKAEVTFINPDNTGLPDVDPSTNASIINNKMIEKSAWTSGYDTAHVHMAANQLGSLRMFNTANYIANWIGQYTEQTSMVVVDRIPENGVVDMSTIRFQAVRYNYTVAADGTVVNGAPVSAGTVLPFERNSQWHSATRYFTQIYQTAGDTYDSLYAKVKAHNLSYAVYRDAASGGDTFLANVSNNTLKYTDFEPGLENSAQVKKIYGSAGPSNGNVVTFNIDFDTHYPSVVDKKAMKNTATVSSDQEPAGGWHTTHTSAEYTIDKSSANGKVAVGTIRLNLIKEDDQQPIANADFKLQLKTGGSWKDYFINGKPASAKTNSNGELTISGLASGTYRIVQTSTVEGYIFTNDNFRDNADPVNAGSVSTEGEFSVNRATDQFGFSTKLTNFMPQPAEFALKAVKKLLKENVETAIPENTFEVSVEADGSNDTTGYTDFADASATISTTGEVQFSPMKIVKAGTYRFYLKEINTGNPRYVYDDQAVEVVLKATVDITNKAIAVEASYQKDNREVPNALFVNHVVITAMSIDPPLVNELPLLYMVHLNDPQGKYTGERYVGVEPNQSIASDTLPAQKMEADPVDFEKDGQRYHFVGWKYTDKATNTEKDFTEMTVVSDGMVDTNTYTLEVTAQWEISKIVPPSDSDVKTTVRTADENHILFWVGLELFTLLIGVFAIHQHSRYSE